MAKIKGIKRPAAHSSTQPQLLKKRKVEADRDPIKKPRTLKEKASERKTIPIPAVDSGDSGESDVDEDDLLFYKEVSPSRVFLNGLDQKAIARSKHEEKRLHKLTKPARIHADHDDLPSIASHDDDPQLWDSDLGKDSGSEGDPEGDSDLDSDGSESDGPASSDTEQSYERQPRVRAPSREAPRWNPSKTGSLAGPAPEELSDSDSDASSTGPKSRPDAHPGSRVEDVSTGARFGRPAVVTIIGARSRKARIQGAKEQLAGICQEILADPENSLGLLRRLHSFALPSIATQTHPKPVANDPLIRKLAFLSQLAVFKDIIPGYRIRPLTDKEKAEKVSQMVQRTRDYEQGLVGVYQNYLQVLEDEIKAKSELSGTALRCMCSLLTEATHFNYRVNLMSAIVADLSKKSWDESSELCLNTIVTVLRKDNTGETSLEVVRLLNRMVKERRFHVHPNVLSCLLHLRLKSELGGVRASDDRAEKEEDRNKLRKRNDVKRHKGRGKMEDKLHLSKNAKKVLKENKEIEEEMREAEAEVDREERAKTHTETLKLLFVLYFRILKNPHPTPTTSWSSGGNFADLLAVLKTLISRETSDTRTEGPDGGVDAGATLLGEEEGRRQRLMCIVTAFELLSGQGEALVIDLGDFVNFLYVIIVELSVLRGIENVSQTSRASKVPSAGNSPPWRSAAFAKRLLTAALYWPPATVLRVLDFVHTLLVKEPALDSLLSTDDRVTDGIYRPELDDPQLCNVFATSFWELRHLEKTHWDPRVRAEAGKLANFRR
ncbi:hypothetical protein BS47DRAFT_1386499 [Hydnum rufescens UP504]|uniref:Nucleolar complex-associated protein 3 n=1 Tax=Hydnum rufescens UP504 TaxID=1448309 RepID=A0A9P6ABW1_9AGAM|nr:hypothetical protein BS47DRAFT_1386499 [Hydnum rufescens UP504]